MRKLMIGAVMLCLGINNAYALGDGMNVNGLQINPTVAVTGQYDDNITRAETAVISSWATIVRPAVDITAGSDINFVTLGYAFERGDYFDSSNDSYSDHFVTAGTHNEFSSRLFFDAAASYSKSHDARGSTFSGIITGFNTPDRWRESAVNAQLAYGGEQATGRIIVDGGYASKRYDNHRSLTVGRDLNTAEAGTSFFYRVGAKTSALLEARYATYDYRLATSQLDSNEITLYGGLTWEATGRTTGTIKGGWQRKKFDLGTNPTSSYFSWDVIIEWSPFTYSTWALGTGQKAKETDGTGSFQKTRHVQLAWSHDWNARFSHSANVGYQRDEFVTTVREDNSTMAGISFNYDLTSWLDVGAGYNYSKRSSNVVGADYTRNLFSLTLMGAL